MKDGKEIPADQLPVQMAAHGKEIRDYEFDLVFEDGTVHTILGDAVPLLDAEAHPYGAVGAFADITERKRIEGQFRRLIENSHDIIYTITTEGVFIFVSPAWTVLLGYPVSEVLGQSFQEFVHPDDIPSCLQWLQKVIETGQRQADIDYRVRHMDGYWRWFTSSAVPLRNEAGRVIGCEGIAKDITERRRVEDAKEKLEFQNRQLQKSESLGRMAGAIAHHFNNQLQAVMMNLQLAMDDLPQNLRSVEDLTDAMQSAHKAAEVSTLVATT
jgi:PAS domain S-box-containing protein